MNKDIFNFEKMMVDLAKLSAEFNKAKEREEERNRNKTRFVITQDGKKRWIITD